MATVNFLLKSKKNPASIYVRFSAGRNIDLCTTSGIHINPQFWDAKNQKIRNVLDVLNRDKINTKLTLLKIYIVDAYNSAFMDGDVIGADWLNSTIKTFFNRPKGEEKALIDNSKIYLTDFATWWLKEKAPKYKVSADKYMDERTQGHYIQVKDLMVAMEGKRKIALKNITADVMDQFSTFLTEKEGYAEQTAKRMLSRFKFFCARAEEENLDVNKNYKQRVFVAKDEKTYKEPYLTEEEIERIYKHDFSDNDLLDNVRDNLIISVWTALRVSDFLRRLKIEDIQGNYIEIVTKKTGTPVAIPMHPHIQAILKKRNGNLPRKISDQKYNDYLKIVGQLVEIEQEMQGSVIEVDKKTKKKRKVSGVYKKYELMTSHIGRRTFCSIHFGQIPNNVIMAIAGWSNEAMMLKYMKRTNLENAKLLEKHWNKKYA